MIIFGAVAVIAFTGIIQNNRKSQQFKSELNNTYEFKLQNWKHIDEAEKNIHASYIEISRAINHLSLEKKEIPQNISNAAENLSMAKEKLNRFHRINYSDVNQLSTRIQELSINMDRYSASYDKMTSFLMAADSIPIIRQYYATTYSDSYHHLDEAFTKLQRTGEYLIEKDLQAGMNKIDQMRNNQFLVLAIIIFFLIVTGYLFDMSLQKPLNEIKDTIKKLSNGLLPERFNNISKNELGDIKKTLNKYVSGIKETAHFAKQIGEGNLDVEYRPLSEEDILGNSLLDMRKDLMKAREDEQIRKTEDEKRSWANQGQAKFAEILRKDNDNVEKLANDVLSHLVEYLDANQGGLFIYNEEGDDQPHLELLASYAYNRRKYLHKTIQLGEGLIGTCAIEKETVFMTQIPDNYLEITSGLGDSNPRSLLIVPLKIDDEIFGVIELASFNPFESYQIEFVEKLGESIASTISSVKINARTKELLEESNKQAEDMATKEEELRQNLEELEATQEALSLNEAKAKLIFENVIDPIITLDEQGNIDMFSPSAERFFGYKANELAGRNLSAILVAETDLNLNNFMQRFIVSDIEAGETEALTATGKHKDGTEIPVDLRIKESVLGNKKVYVAMFREYQKQKTEA